MTIIFMIGMSSVCDSACSRDYHNDTGSRILDLGIRFVLHELRKEEERRESGGGGSRAHHELGAARLRESREGQQKSGGGRAPSR
jgi:hypothetical protein